MHRSFMVNNNFCIFENKTSTFKYKFKIIVVDYNFQFNL